MDKEHLKVHSRIANHEQECHTKQEGYVEAPGAEDPKTSVRRSTRLEIKRKLSSCSQDTFKSYHNSLKKSMKSSKPSLFRENSISGSKIQEDYMHQFQHKNETNGVFSADTASMKSSTVIPSFEYHVQSPDGIQLVVDLNLKRSDWLKSIEKTVCVCANHLNIKSRSFQKEVECLGVRNNLKISSHDKTTTASDTTSMNFYVQNKFSTESMSREIGKTLLPSECSGTEKVLTITTEVNQEMGGNLRRSTVENEERTNSDEGMEVSGKEEKAIVISSISGYGPKRKKCCRKSDHILGQSHERILRSTKLYGGQIVECGGLVARRSSRLHSKAVTVAGGNH